MPSVAHFFVYERMPYDLNRKTFASQKNIQNTVILVTSFQEKIIGLVFINIITLQEVVLLSGYSSGTLFTERP